MRSLTIAAIALAAVALSSSTFAADEVKPDQPVQIIAGASPGGGYDRMARMIAKELEAQKLVDVPITVVNKPGGGGALGWAYINRFQGKMNYLSMTATAFLSNVLLGVSPLKMEDFTVLATLVDEDLCVAVNPKGKITSAEQLFKTMKEHPENLRFGFSTAIGNQNHVLLVRLAQELGADVSKINTAVFGGASESTVALLGNNIDFSISGGETFAGYQISGELKCVAVSGEGRLGGELADVPTLKELGVNLSYSPTRGVIAPGGLSAEQIAFWDKALKTMSESADWKETAEKAYWRVDYKDSKAATEANAKDRDELRAVYSTLGIIKK